MPTLHWLTKQNDVKAAEKTPYKLLEEVPALSGGDPDNENMLIQGDNLEALKALLPFYAGQVKCIYIDPPYNTGSAFQHYDDNLEHATWLAMMYPRLVLLRELLADNGSLWISIDDDEGHYLKVICDEIFGRKKFVCNVVWQKRYSRENREAIGDSHEHLLLYAPNPVYFKETRNYLPLTEKQMKLYANPDNDPRGMWQSVSLLAQGYRPNQMYVITAPNGKKHKPPSGNCWKVIESEFRKALADNRIVFGADGNGVPRRKQFLYESKGLVPWSWWTHEEVGHTDEAKKEINTLFGADNPFDTPKPERLIQRMIHISTNPGDLVLDSFLGSGTTAAVAHKMGRRYIGIEMGEHARSHCAVRLQKVIEGEEGGISKAVHWQGGGGFRFYQLGAPVFTPEGRINENVRFCNLAAHVWFAETKIALGKQAQRKQRRKSPFLGIHDGTAIALLYNGILGDKSIGGGNVLTSKTLQMIADNLGDRKYDKMIIYGEASRIGSEKLKKLKIEFKQIPYKVK